MSSPHLFVLYGSVTGNAEHIAKDLAAKLDNHSSCCCELDMFKKQCVKTWESGEPCILILVTSTTGNGDAPDNAGRFVRYIKRCKDPLYFQHCQFAVLALGDTNYDKFCATGKTVDKKMGDLGGKRIRSVALADEATGLEDVVEPWCEEMIVKVKALMGGAVDGDAHVQEEYKEDQPIASTTRTSSSSAVGVRLVKSLLQKEADCQLSSLLDTNALPTSLRLSRASCVFVTGNSEPIDDDATSVGSSTSDCRYSAASPYTSTIVGARYLTNTDTEPSKRAANDPTKATEIYDTAFPLNGPNAERNGKRVIEVDLAVPGTEKGWEYEPGDSIGLLVPNSERAVAYMANLLSKHHGLAADSRVQIDGKPPMTIQSALTSIVDLSSPVSKTSKRMFGAWSQYISLVNSDEAATFQLMSSKSEIGDTLCRVLCEEQRWTVVDFIKAFPALEKMTFEDLMSSLPPLPPRYYSVASSPLDSTVKIGFSVVDYTTPSLAPEGKECGQRRVRGLATGWLERLTSTYLAGISPPATSSFAISLFPKPTADFRMPEDPNAKLILIGPGTGIAPFVGFLRHKRSKHGSSSNSGEIDVYFGCRHENHDFLYRSEMETLSTEGIITNLYLSFSRDEGSQFRYVQDRLREQSERLMKQLTEDGASVYLCGDGNAMAKDVQSTFVELFKKRFGSQEKANSYLEELKSTGRFRLDIWS